MVKLNVSLNGFTPVTGLEGTANDGSDNLAISLKFGDVINSIFARPQSKEMPGFADSQNTPKTGAGFTATHPEKRGFSNYDDRGRAIIHVTGSGNTSRYTHATNATKTQANNILGQGRLASITGGRGEFGYFKSTQTAVRDFLGFFFNSNGTFDIRIYDTSGVATGSGAFTQTIGVAEEDVPLYYQIEHDEAADEIIGSIWLSAPAEAFGTLWTSPDETKTVDISGKSISLNQFGLASWGIGFNGKAYRLFEAASDCNDFEQYSKATLVAVLPSFAAAGTLIRTKATAIMTENRAVDAPLGLTNTKLQVSVNVDGGGFDPFKTVAVHAAAGNLTPATSLQYRFQFQNDDFGTLLELLKFVGGDWADTVIVEDYPANGDVKSGVVFHNTTQTGTRDDAAAPVVLAGSGNYGDPGSPLVPSFVPDYPERVNTLDTDTVNGLAGRWGIADKAKYQESETFGIDGVSEVGELESGGINVFSPVVGETEFTLQKQIQFEVQNN